MDSSSCAHLRITGWAEQEADGAMRSGWQCAECGVPFWPVPIHGQAAAVTAFAAAIGTMRKYVDETSTAPGSDVPMPTDRVIGWVNALDAVLELLRAGETPR